MVLQAQWLQNLLMALEILNKGCNHVSLLMLGQGLVRTMASGITCGSSYHACFEYLPSEFKQSYVCCFLIVLFLLYISNFDNLVYIWMLILYIVSFHRLFGC